MSKKSKIITGLGAASVRPQPISFCTWTLFDQTLNRKKLKKGKAAESGRRGSE